MAKDETQKEKARERLCDSLKQVEERRFIRVQKESTKIQYKGKKLSEESLVPSFLISERVILNAFVNEALPSEFETIGKQIVEKCQGLPLCVVVAGLLSKSKRTIEDWGSVAKDVKSFVTKDPDEQCLHRVLKFEKDLEGVAEKCLQDLIDRCLVLVSNKSLNETRIRYCKVHDLIYELCLREAQKAKHFVMNDIVYVDYDGDYNLDEDDDWDEYANLDEDKAIVLTDDDEGEEDEEDEEDDLEAEDEDDKMLFKNKFRRLSIMGRLALKMITAYEPMTIPSAKAFPAALQEVKVVQNWSKVGGLECHSDLKYWKVTNDSFPVLERLVIRGCTKLEEIPIEFVETISLQLIE
ncbi:hypothetical protein HAX54_033089 [Datura stramonium]|uniref:Disease resistance protein winged helix domain-containing protein n=1 Tax=Datura stramonium TaxID=4076 RepID=A0ABS8VF28_DATST|nr:hypothetical protein [Datura stramonium]